MPKTKKTIILDRDALPLREISLPVPISEIGSKEINRIIEKMRGAMYGENDSVAIAAPQIGENLRIFLVRGSVLGTEEEPQEDLVVINPEIVKVSKKKQPMEEGCLSVRWLYGVVLRHEKITINALNEKGESLHIGASGLIAQIFQHEIDHLDGILFIDKAENVRNLPPETNAKS